MEVRQAASNLFPDKMQLGLKWVTLTLPQPHACRLQCKLPLGAPQGCAENAWKCMKNCSKLAETVRIHHGHGDRGQQVIHSIIIQ